MFELPERYLARVWVGDLALEPTAAGFARLAAALGSEDMQPNPFQELGPLGVYQGIGLRSADGSFSALARRDSVDLEWRPGVERHLTFSEFLGDAGKRLSGVLRSFSRTATRLAAIQEGFLREDKPVVAAAASRLLRLSESFPPDEVFEWDWRAAVVREREFAGVRERTNTIASIKRIAGTFASPGTHVKFDTLRVSTDINTLPSETSARFTPESVTGFFAESADWHRRLEGELLAFVGMSEHE